MHDFDHLAADYIATWNEKDPTARRALIERSWAADARYVDPLADVSGHDGVDAAVAGVQQTFAGFEFRLAGPVDGHHDQCRFGWELGPAGQDAPIAGFDVIEIDGSGRIRKVLGFLDRVPAEAA